MLQRIRDWWQQWRCPHWQTAVHTFIENDDAPLVRRQMVCLICGKRGGDLPPIGNDVLLDLLERAKQLPAGSSVKI
jgi:hypothetical protein